MGSHSPPANCSRNPGVKSGQTDDALRRDSSRPLRDPVAARRGRDGGGLPGETICDRDAVLQEMICTSCSAAIRGRCALLLRVRPSGEFGFASADWAGFAFRSGGRSATQPLVRPSRPSGVLGLDRRRRVYAGRGAGGAVPDHRAARPRRDGRGLPGRRPEARAAGGAEVPARGTSPRKDAAASGSTPRFGSRGRCRTRTCAGCTTSARSRGCTTYRWSTWTGRIWRRC